MVTHSDNWNVPTNPYERSLWIRYQLGLKGETLAGLARKNGWARPIITRCFYQPLYWQEKAIADALGIPIPVLFPERYDAHGKRLHRVRAFDDKKGCHAAERLKRIAQ